MTMDLGLEEIRELIELLNGSDLCELKLEAGDVKLSLKKAAASAAPPAQPAAQSAAPALAVTYAGTPSPAPANSAPEPTGTAPGTTAERSNLYLIRSPMVGTFYRAPSPDNPPFVEVGQFVEPGQTVCIIEAMKLMNEIETDHGGKIARICVNNGEAVEFGQLLFEIER